MYKSEKETTRLVSLKITFLLFQSVRENSYFGFASGDIQEGERLFWLNEDAGIQSRDSLNMVDHKYFFRCQLIISTLSIKSHLILKWNMILL